MDDSPGHARTPFILFVGGAPILLPLKEKLREKNLTVFQCNNAEEALYAIEKFQFGLILIDLLVPGGFSGYDLCRKFKESERTEETPIVLLCDHPLPMEVTFGYSFDLKAERLMLPPFDLEDISRQICRIFRPDG